MTGVMRARDQRSQLGTRSTKAGLVADMTKKCSGEFMTTSKMLPQVNCQGRKDEICQAQKMSQ